MVMVKDNNYIQFDDAIQQVISIPKDIIRQNLNILASEISLSRANYTKLMNGEVIQLGGKKETFSIGIDLNDNMGIRISKGSMMAWKEETEVEKLPHYNFGLYGCWLSDDLGNLSYVPEEEYTDEMGAEQLRAGRQRAAAAQMGSMAQHR